jgi:hypothetical protein
MRRCSATASRSREGGYSKAIRAVPGADDRDTEIVLTGVAPARWEALERAGALRGLGVRIQVRCAEAGGEVLKERRGRAQVVSVTPRRPPREPVLTPSAEAGR